LAEEQRLIDEAKKRLQQQEENEKTTIIGSAISTVLAEEQRIIDEAKKRLQQQEENEKTAIIGSAISSILAEEQRIIPYEEEMVVSTAIGAVFAAQLNSVSVQPPPPIEINERDDIIENFKIKILKDLHHKESIETTIDVIKYIKILFENTPPPRDKGTYTNYKKRHINYILDTEEKIKNNKLSMTQIIIFKNTPAYIIIKLMDHLIEKKYIENKNDEILQLQGSYNKEQYNILRSFIDYVYKVYKQNKRSRIEDVKFNDDNLKNQVITINSEGEPVYSPMPSSSSNSPISSSPVFNKIKYEPRTPILPRPTTQRPMIRNSSAFGLEGGNPTSLHNRVPSIYTSKKKYNFKNKTFKKRR
jgi:hypothetical protein